MATDFEGSFSADKVYTIEEIARLLGVKQTRTALDWLHEIDVPLTPGPRGRQLTTGRLIHLAIERAARCHGTDANA